MQKVIDDYLEFTTRSEPEKEDLHGLLWNLFHSERYGTPQERIKIVLQLTNLLQ